MQSAALFGQEKCPKIQYVIIVSALRVPKAMPCQGMNVGVKLWRKIKIYRIVVNQLYCQVLLKAFIN